VIAGGEFTIGRGPDNDWTLVDPEKILSKRHCIIAFRAGGWQLADLSTNGTYLNRSDEPVGPQVPQDLRNGDRLQLGGYEIEITIQDDAVRAAADRRSAYPPLSPPVAGPFADPFGDDPFRASAVSSAVAHGNPLGTDPLLRAGTADENISPSSIRLPANYDPLRPDPDDTPFAAPTVSDHAFALEGSFRTPTPAPTSIPDDEWDTDLSTPLPLGAPPVETRAPSAPPPVTRPAPVRAPAPPAPVPVTLSPAAAPPASAVLQPQPASAAAAAEPRNPFDSEAIATVVMPAAQDPPAMARPMPGAPIPGAPIPGETAGPAPAIPSAPLLAAFLKGAGLADVQPADPVATFEQLGASFRALVGGLRQALIARASVKGEFRIEQTMIQARGNNPLKFSAGDDDALLALLGAGRRSDMTPAVAIGDALEDMRLHELASVSAMQAGVRALLERFAPAPLLAKAEKGSRLLPGQQKARAFEQFEALYREVSQALSDDFDSVFGKAFARAYEQATREIANKEDHR
jgi:type VI secretion system FHA domain protein